MTKVIVLSTVLGLSALGMACGEAASNNGNKPANNANTSTPTPAPVNTATPATNVTAPNANAPKTNTPPANAPKTNMATPAPSATKKP